jgi:DNA (cytosine-5)-methyltransferase 1
MLRLAELFTGTGAFSLAFHQAAATVNTTDNNGIRTVFANDFSPDSKVMFDANSASTGSVRLTHDDIHNLKPENIPPMDILTGGPNCQPFSIAGKQAGFDDERSNVFWAMFKIIKHHKPQVVVIENVKNLVAHDEGNTFATIQNALLAMGYHLRHQVLDTAKVTRIPHHRERIYIVGFLDPDKALDFQFPVSLPVTTVKYTVSQMLESAPIPAKYYYDERFKVWPIVQEGVVKNVSEHNTLYQLRRQYIRENKRQVCPTLTCNGGSGGHNIPLLRDTHGIRKLTPRECFNFQGFPQSYVLPTSLSDAALYRLAGNSVSVPVVELIAREILRVLQAP